MNHATPYPIGTPGKPWGTAELDAWRATQVKQRSYSDEVEKAIDALRGAYDVEDYGSVSYAGEAYTFHVLRTRDWRDDLPVMVVTGGVHGYETSGVHGALQFLREHGNDYAGRANVLVVPCVSPWAYERIHRWNYDAIDPNRNFREGSPAAESAALVRLLAPLGDKVLMHIDLHETTDTDESEFRPALAARDGKEYEPGEIPDGFYLVDDADKPQPAFQKAVIDAVAKVTHIAPADANGEIIGSPEVAHGVIEYALKPLGLCAGITPARFCTTTEVYPDSPRATPQQCNDAQVAAVRASIDYALAHAGQ
jgi:hypothetical protein